MMRPGPYLAERVSRFYGEARRASVVNGVLAALSAWAVYGNVPGRALALWGLLVCASLLLRLAVVALRARDPAADAHALRWAWCATGALAASGLCWGLGVPMLLAHAGPDEVTFWTIALCGIAGGVVAGTPWFVPAQWAYLLPMLAPLIALHLQRGTQAHLAVAGGLSLFLVFCLLQGRALARALHDSLAVRAENRALLAQAREAAEARSRFFAAASHDLRQPVQALVLLDAAIAQAGGAERTRLQARLSEGIAALDALAESLLDVARLDAGAAVLVAAPVRLGPLLQRLAARHDRPGSRRCLWRLSRHVDAVQADPAALERIVSNLLTNAWRHGGGTVLLAARHGRDGSVRLQVRDGGPGIAREHQARVFEPFFQVGNAQRDRAAGTGLGLPTAQGLARALGGTLVLRSAPGRGCCFELRLPAAATAPAATTAPAVATTPVATTTPAAVAEAPPAGAVQARVVLIDDDPLVRDALATLLRQWGAQVHAAAGADLLPADTPPPDLLLCDLMLAGSSGLEQARVLQARWPGAPRTVLMSGSRDAAAREQAVARGWGWLDKPVRPMALRAVLDAPRQAAGARADRS